ncbi:unnamed protein product [Blepharisma stoltei]|uniref:XLF-like N-terminal domain-containing protein n=1 Tax=Blepharisma stoltei TaxID=1481888 RepID=A0AAU9IDA2_9CILI|nr:unnamed protein product [Blepharisma stoltei]
MDIWKTFFLTHLDSLKLLEDKNWWSLTQDDEIWMIKAKAVSGNDGSASYALILTNMRDTYFSSAGTTQIQQEITQYNPNIQGGMAGLVNMLNTIISKKDPQSTYKIRIDQNSAEFEAKKTLSAIYEFNWKFSAIQLDEDISKRILSTLMVIPLCKTVVAQDSLIKQLEDQAGARRNAVDMKLFVPKNIEEIPCPELAQHTVAALNESYAQPVREIEGYVRVENERKRKFIEEAKEPIKKFRANSPKPQQKSKVDYKESEEEVRRKRELEIKLAMGKKGKKKLEFV